jgi:hypothetical protein
LFSVPLTDQFPNAIPFFPVEIIACAFSFGHCVACHEFWLPLWYLQTLSYKQLRTEWVIFSGTLNKNWKSKTNCSVHL